VAHLDAELPPTSSFPSGHTAASICLYGTIAALVLALSRGWWRWLVLTLAVLVIVAVALARLYRGAHFPTDVLGSILFAVPWLLITLKLLRLQADAEGDRRDAADRGAPGATNQPTPRE
jgi:undecaprenyl-diphosphatase